MWPFRTKNRDQPAAAKLAEVDLFTGDTEIIPRLTRGIHDYVRFPLIDDGPPGEAEKTCPAPSPEWLAETKQLTPVVSSDVRALAAAHARLETADWNAERAAREELRDLPAGVQAAMLADQSHRFVERMAKAKLERLPSDDPMLSTDHLPETFWAISREGDHRVYRTPGGIKSALTQLGWKEDGDVWKGVVYWHRVTEDYTDRPTA